MATDEQVFEVQVILNSDKIFEIDRAWNELVGQSCENPFMLSSFVLQIIKSSCSENNSPLIPVFLCKNRIIGIAPFMSKKTLGVRSVKFVNKSDVTPDLIVDNQYREILIAQMLDFLFTNLKCKFVELSLPVESPNLQIIREQCKVKGINFRLSPEMGHRILPVTCSWGEFESARGKNFRQQFRKIERKLDQAGKWQVLCVDGDEGTVAVEKILDVEKRSWKQTWRMQKGEDADEDLVAFIEASKRAAAIEPAFKWKVWFLEFNSQTVAYLLVLQYRGVAYLTKTSYDQQYKGFYPGQYLRKIAICKLFNERQVKTIDFLTDLPHHLTWTPVCKRRVRITMAKGVIPILTQSQFTNDLLKMSQRLLNYAPILQSIALC
jgi:hypothetical protein